MLYTFFWVIHRRLNLISRRFGTLCLFHLHRRIGMKNDWGWEMLGYLYGERFGSSQTFPRINTLTISNLVILHTYPPIKMEQRECSETSAYKIQTPGNYPEESIQHSEHGESLKSRIFKNEFPAEERRHCLHVTKSNWLTLFRKLLVLDFVNQ